MCLLTHVLKLHHVVYGSQDAVPTSKCALSKQNQTPNLSPTSAANISDPFTLHVSKETLKIYIFQKAIMAQYHRDHFAV